jgi:Flp pilus assembly protein TadD/serine/threonine protein kinase
MSADFDKARDLFLAAVERAPGHWDQFLDEACAGDADLRGAVAALLKAHADGGSLFDDRDPNRTAAFRSVAEQPGDVIGSYKLLEQIGEGGFGVVFMAEQQEPVRRKVALKVLKPGMDSRQVVGRFEGERQALALMDHPNIARVFDGGLTSNGRPYFVMELVKGVSITEFCDRNRLTPRRRLELFASVCQAVQHAHQKGIIHRDIKPSNVLVSVHDATPVVKVIDFGVAKALGQELTDKTVFTGFAQMIGTPMYMSPEQAGESALDVDTRSDIYSLGVVLYELLTGTTPFDRKRFKQAAHDEIRRIIREEEPPKPSTRLSTTEELPSVAANRSSEPKKLGKIVRGELDWIVMKCLEKDRNRRYETANGLAMDLQRYLADEPVQACPPSAGYRIRKFARRNKNPLLTSCLVIGFLVVIGAVAAFVLRDRAGRRARFNPEVAAAIQEATVLSEQARAAIDSPRQGESAFNAALAARRRAEVLAESASDLLDATLRQRLGDLDARLLADEEDRRLAATVETIRLERSDFNVQEEGFSFRESASRYRATFEGAGLSVGKGPAEVAALIVGKPPGLRSVLVAALDDWLGVAPSGADADWIVAVLGSADEDQWRNEVRAALMKRQRDALETLAGRPEADAQPPATLDNLADALRKCEAHAAAVRVLRRAQERYPADFWVNHSLASALRNGRPRQPARAVEFLRVALALRPDNAGVHMNLGNALKDAGDEAGAAAAYQNAIRLQPGYAAAHYNFGNHLKDRRDWPAALGQYRKAIELRPDYAQAYNNLGYVLGESGDRAAALAAYDKALTLNPDLAQPYLNIGNDQLAHQDFAGAVETYRKGIAAGPDLPHAYCGLGQAYEALGDRVGAATAFRDAIQREPDFAEAHNGLGKVLQADGDWAGALVAFRKATELKPDYVIAHSNLGAAQCMARDLPGAIASLRKAIELKPNHVAGHVNLGTVLTETRDYPGAVTAFRKAIELDPRRPEPHNNLGNVLKQTGDLPGAIGEYRKAIELRPNDAMAHFNLGAAMTQTGELDKALAELHRAIELKPNYPDALTQLGLALAAKNDLPGAITAYRKALSYKPDDVPALGNLGTALSASGDKTGAEAVLRKAVTAHPRDGLLYSSLGLVLHDKGDYSAAVAAHQKAVELEPASAAAHYNLGNSLLLKGEWKGAVGAYRKAIELRPNHARSHSNLGNALAAGGDLPAAVGAFRRALELKPDLVQAHLNLAEALAKQGNWPEALTCFQKAVESEPKFADAHASLALALANCPEPKLRDPKRALMHAEKAIELDPTAGTAWEALGIARYRAGELRPAVAALEKSASLREAGAQAWFFEAMARWQLGENEKAREWFDKAVNWTEKHRPADDLLQSVRAEAAALLGVPASAK